MLMKNNNYFPHDSNAKDDPKCVLLIESLNPEGYGIFWILIELLKDQPNFKYPVQLIPSISRKYNTTTEKVKAVIYNFGLFEVENDMFFYSISLVNRMAEIAEKKLRMSQGGKKAMLERWQKNKIELPEKIVNQKNDKVVISTLSENDKVVITSKVKESKYNSKSKDINIYISPEKFYKNEIERIEHSHPYKKHYETLIDFLNGKNPTHKPLENILKVRDQITFEQFIDLLKTKAENVKITDILLKMENDNKYCKGKKYLAVTIKNWITNRFNKF